jgi:hypothetical protein
MNYLKFAAVVNAVVLSFMAINIMTTRSYIDRHQRACLQLVKDTARERGTSRSFYELQAKAWLECK